MRRFRYSLVQSRTFLVSRQYSDLGGLAANARVALYHYKNTFTSFSQLISILHVELN